MTMALVKNTNCGFVTVAPSADPDGTGDTIDYRARALKCEAPPHSTKVTEIGWYCDNATEAANYEVGIYDHNPSDNNPEALIGKSSPTAKGTTAGWKKATGLNIAITPGQIYWIGLALGNTETATEINVTNIVGEKYDKKDSVTELTDPWGVTVAFYVALAAIYAVYETSVPANVISHGNLYGEVPNGSLIN